MAVYRFGEFEVDPGRRELHRGRELVHLEPQAFDLLLCLLEHRDRIVSKVELLDGVWGHRFVSEANLTTRVKEARRAVGDDGAGQHTIRNVRGRGYRFVAPVEIIHDEPRPHSGRSTLIGRDVELAAVVDLLDRTPLVTLTGPGGVGKSALGRAIAAHLSGARPHGAHVVEMAALDAGSHVAPSVARALDIVFDEDRPEHALRSIACLDALLVLDNCEHLVDDVADVVDRLVSAADLKLRILATSQVRLGLSSEAVQAVGPLSHPAASELFAARVAAVAPSWDRASIGPERIDRLVSALDRLPLTVEMAAARLGSMNFEDLEAAIAERTALLQLSHRAPARRHRSLESIVDWSTTSLEPRRRDLFSGFSVFAGRVRATDATAVLQPADQAGAIFDLAALAERSLLVTDVSEPDTRYSMLTTVRTVAERWLEDSGAGDTLRRRHAEYVYDVLRDIDDRLRTPDELGARHRLAGLVDEARAAHHWAQHHDPGLASHMSAALFHAAYSSLWLEPAEWSRALLTGLVDGRAAAPFGAIAVSAGAAAHRGDLRLAREQAGIVAASATGRLRAIGLELLADVALYQGDLEAVGRAATELRRLGDDLGDRHASAFGAVDAALARTYAGDPGGALEDLNRLDLGELAPTDAAWLAYARGDALSLARQPEGAAAFRQAIELGSMVGNRYVISVALTSLASELARSGERESALEAYGHCLADFRRHGNYTHAVTAVRNLIELLEAIGDDRGATILAAAMSDGHLRPSYGAEAETIAAVVERAQRRAGPIQFTAWLRQGRSLDLDGAIRTAAELVDQHRR